MTSYVARYLGLDTTQAKQARHQGFLQHGTTLRWLMHEQHLPDPAEFLEYVHPDNLADWLPPQPELPALLQSLHLPKAILTNAPRSHALRVLEYFGIAGYFSAIVDISMNDYQGKPFGTAYQTAMAHLGWAADTTLFADDIPGYLEGFARLGGQCLLVDEQGRHQDTPYRRIPSIYRMPAVLGPHPGGQLS